MNIIDPLMRIAVQTARVNVLLIGQDQEVDEAVRALQGLVRQPIVCCRASAFTLAPDFDGSLVLRDAEGLSAIDQQRMLEWISDRQGPRQVITTCCTPLFAAVRRGAFSEALYYRLNMLTFVLRPATLPRSFPN